MRSAVNRLLWSSHWISRRFNFRSPRSLSVDSANTDGSAKTAVLQLIVNVFRAPSGFCNPSELPICHLAKDFRFVPCLAVVPEGHPDCGLPSARYRSIADALHRAGAHRFAVDIRRFCRHSSDHIRPFHDRPLLRIP